MMRNTTIDTLLQTRRLTTAYRVLTCDLAWPTPYGEPPFASGAVSVPAMPTTPPVYAAASFNAAAWTDVTGLVTAYRYAQANEQQCDALTLTVPCAWASSDLDRVFRAMRAIVVQERCTGAGGDTGWVSRCWCLSSGYALRWDASQGAQLWTVNALDALALAGLDVLGGATGSAVYQADLVEVGSADTHYDMYEVSDDAADAWEYAVVDAGNHLYPNWADRPGPQCWCHNVPGQTEPVPLAIGGDAVQAVFGEGVVRVSKNWARGAVGSNKDYSSGLGFTGGTRPDIRCHLWRFAQPGIVNRDGDTVTSDIATGLTQLANPPVAGEVRVTGDLSALPQRLTLLLWDGTGARYATSSHSHAGGVTTFTLVDAAAVVPTGAAVQYGDANRAVDLVRRWLVESGYQLADDTAPLYAQAPAAPVLKGAALPLLVPPLVFTDTDRVTRLQALAELRSRYAVLPSWQTRATATGQIATATVQQLFDDETGPNASILPLAHVTAADADKTDLNVFTRVIARGAVRQVADLLDIARNPGVTIADVDEAGGGLPDLDAGSGDYHFAVTWNGTTYNVRNAALRSGATGDDYNFVLSSLGDRAKQPTTNHRSLRPWAWGIQEMAVDGETPDFDAFKTDLPNAWMNKPLCVITLPSAQEIDAVELLMPNPWKTSHTDWYDLGTRKDATPQRLRLDYWDSAQGQYRPLTEDITGNIEYPFSVRVESADFLTRAAISTDKLRVVCVQPFVGWWRWFYSDVTAVPPSQFWYRATIGVYLWQLKVFGGSELRGTAEIGTADGFDSAAWVAARDRFRRRTFVVPDVADWANTQADVDDLAEEWLYEVTRNLAPRPVTAVRPDAALGDTVRLPLPNGQVACYPTAQTQLTGWRLFGLSMANSDDLLLYWTLTNSGTTRTVNLYSDAARTALVASGSRAGNGAITLTAANNSRVSGTVTVAYTGNTSGTVAPPTYLITGVEHGGDAGRPAPSRFTLVNYRDPYFEE